MAYINVDIEDHLGEVNTKGLLKEIKRRTITDQQKREIAKWESLDDMQEAMAYLHISSLRDVVKFEAFISCFRDIPEAELDEFLSKYKS